MGQVPTPRTLSRDKAVFKVISLPAGFPDHFEGKTSNANHHLNTRPADGRLRMLDESKRDDGGPRKKRKMSCSKTDPRF